MTLKRKPISVWELKKNPSLLHQFTTPQLYNLLQQLNEWFPTPSGKSIPPSPSLLAQSLSRGRWHEAKHLEFISKQLVELEKGERERLLISTPPRHGKSELISKWFPFWYLTKHPDSKVILASYEAEFAASWGRKVRNLVIEHGSKYGLFLTDDSTAAHRWELKSEGGMMTAGAAGPITGKGAALLIIDDPIKNDEEASSKVYREKLWNWFQTTALTRLDPGGKVAIIGTRWHEDDLIGRLEAHSESGEGLPWDIIKLPAIAEENDDLGRAVGEALWPERITLKDLESKRSGMSPYHWSSLFQQHPSPEEGGAIKRIWWKFYTEAPAEFDQMIQSWDLSFKDLKNSDYVVGQVWGRVGGEFYLIHQVRARMGAPETIAALRGVWAQYPKAVAKLVEDKANGPAVIALLNKEVPGLIPFKVKGSKEARLGAVIPLFEAGNVYVPHPSTGITWVNDLIEEAAAFPNGAHDDQCFVADTFVATPLGPVKIKDIKVGDLVLVPGGVSRVTGAGCTGVASTITNLGLTGTPQHKVWQGGKFEKLLDSSKSLCDSINLWNQIRWAVLRSSVTTGWFTSSWGGRAVIISVSQERCLSDVVQKVFTSPSGNLTWGSKFLKVLSFIIRTVTFSTIALATWSAYRAGSTFATILEGRLIQRCWNTWLKSGSSLFHGIRARLEELGINYMPELEYGLPVHTSALFAEKSFKRSEQLNTALPIVDIEADDWQATTISLGSVLSVARNFLGFFQLTPERKVRYAVDLVEPKAEVYNLSTEAGVFYANEILVSNCDALSQALTFLQPGAWRGAKRAERELETLGKMEKTTEGLMTGAIHEMLRKHAKKGEKAMRRMEREERGFFLGRSAHRMW